MAVYIPEPVAYLNPEELKAYQEKQALLFALIDNPGQFDQYETMRAHFEMFVFLGTVYHEHGLAPTIDLIINPATGAVTYEEVRVEVED